MSTPEEWKQFKEAVREATDIVELIQQKEPTLQERGTVWRGVEGWPSLIVYKDSGLWFDHGGDRNGDCFAWLMEMEGLTFIESLTLLAERAGIDKPAWSGESAEDEDEKRKIQRIQSWCVSHYHRLLPSKIRRKILKSGYGFTDEIIDKLKIGWADGTCYFSAKDHFGDQYSEEDFLATGLFRPTKKGPVDVFEERVVFPYWRMGRVRYLIARRVEGYTGNEDWELAKYKKLPVRTAKRDYVSEHVREPIFNEDAVRNAEEVLITEGVTDCISAMQAGIPCLSPVTVRFKDKHIPLLRGLLKKVKRVVIINDSEENASG